MSIDRRSLLEKKPNLYEWTTDETNFLVKTYTKIIATIALKEKVDEFEDLGQFLKFHEEGEVPDEYLHEWMNANIFVANSIDSDGNWLGQTNAVDTPDGRILRVKYAPIPHSLRKQVNPSLTPLDLCFSDRVRYIGNELEAEQALLALRSDYNLNELEAEQALLALRIREGEGHAQSH